MDAFNPRSLQREVREIAGLEAQHKDMRLMIGSVESQLRELHAEELGDTMLVLSVYTMYRTLFVMERLVDPPDAVARRRYVIAMRFFAREHLRLLT